MAPRIFAAVDLGASGGRVMAGIVDGASVRVEAVHRFPNGIVEIDGHLRWDIAALREHVATGLARLDGAESIGIDTWGVDYGLLDADGELIAPPIAYRDDRTAAVIDAVHAKVGPRELFAVNGIQFLPFNTIYQLAAERSGPNWERARHALMLPDLFAYWLTGTLRSEITSASTSGLLDARAQEWSAPLLERLGIPGDFLPPLERAGEVRGTTTTGVPVTTVASHDTASAVVGVPATTDRFAYVASGTWSLVGLELTEPILTDAARAANFTNELGLDGRIRFLRNVGGLWLLQECMRAWRRNDLDALLDAAAREPSAGPRIDVDDPGFIAPGGMPERIAAAVGGGSLTQPRIVRCILESLAGAYARTVREAARLAGQPVDVIHIVGGGSQNELLCRLTAAAAGVPVLAGPVEATALGNVLVQARARGAVPASLEAMRELLARGTPVRRYEPA